MHATKSKTYEVLTKTAKPAVSAKRLLGWIITGQDFQGIWSSYSDVLGANTFHSEVAKAFLDVSSGNNFELVFVDAAQFTEGAAPEGNLVPVLTWMKPELAPKTGPYKTAAQQNITASAVTPTPARTIESMPVENLAVAAGAGVSPYKDAVQQNLASEAKELPKKPTEALLMSAMTLLAVAAGEKHTMGYETIDALAFKLAKIAEELVETERKRIEV
jgi:hypothetical protein